MRAAQVPAFAGMTWEGAGIFRSMLRCVRSIMRCIVRSVMRCVVRFSSCDGHPRCGLRRPSGLRHSRVGGNLTPDVIPAKAGIQTPDVIPREPPSFPRRRESNAAVHAGSTSSPRGLRHSSADYVVPPPESTSSPAPHAPRLDSRLRGNDVGVCGNLPTDSAVPG